MIAVVTQPTHRRWLRRPQPWIAAGIALSALIPVVVWNTAHGWASFPFQGDRTFGLRVRPLAPLATLGGSALFLLPWIGLMLAVAAARAGRTGRARPDTWLLLCCGGPAILLSAAAALWSARPVPFHWAAPGYLMLFPLLGDLVVRLEPGRRRLVSAGAAATGLLVVSTAAMLAMQKKWNWLPLGFPDPLADAVAWTSLREGVPAGDADVGDGTWSSSRRAARSRECRPATARCSCRSRRRRRWWSCMRDGPPCRSLPISAAIR